MKMSGVLQMMNYPERYMLSSGVGKATHKLVSFDSALISARISNYNLLKVSSILPIGCTKVNSIDKKEGSALLVAYGSLSSNKINETISAAVAVGIPQDPAVPGVIMEHSGFCTGGEADQLVRKMVQEAMKNHGFECKDVISSAVEATVEDDRYVTVIAALSMW